MLHLLGGVDFPTGGIVDWPALGRREELRPGKVQFVFQSNSLLEALTALENVEMPLLLSGMSPLEAANEAFALLEELEPIEDAETLKGPDRIESHRARVRRTSYDCCSAARILSGFESWVSVKTNPPVA